MEFWVCSLHFNVVDMNSSASTLVNSEQMPRYICRDVRLFVVYMSVNSSIGEFYNRRQTIEAAGMIFRW
jgi:hypothetical protein